MQSPLKLPLYFEGSTLGSFGSLQGGHRVTPPPPLRASCGCLDPPLAAGDSWQSHLPSQPSTPVPKEPQRPVLAGSPGITRGPPHGSFRCERTWHGAAALEGPFGALWRCRAGLPAAGPEPELLGYPPREKGGRPKVPSGCVTLGPSGRGVSTMAGLPIPQSPWNCAPRGAIFQGGKTSFLAPVWRKVPTGNRRISLLLHFRARLGEVFLCAGDGSGGPVPRTSHKIQSEHKPHRRRSDRNR